MVSEICGGRDVSNTSTSLANLEIIRPIGVVSKKVNGARITARSITMCIWRAANQQPSCGAKSQKKLAIATTSDMDDCHVTAPDTVRAICGKKNNDSKKLRKHLSHK